MSEKQTNIIPHAPYDLSERIVVTGIGDSNMYGVPDTGDGDLDFPYLKVFGKNIGANEIINLGIPGSTISTNDGGASPTYDSDSIRNPVVRRLEGVPKHTNIFVLQGGVNDFWLGIPLGTIEDTNTDSFYGALNSYYGTIKTRFPSARIIALTMFETDRESLSGVSKEEWVQAQIAVAEKFDIEVFDAFHHSAVTPELADMADGLHLSQADSYTFAEELTDFYNEKFESRREGI
ncbi:SGNH/GDSL hydrolase family protein [Aerococcaceae bacterium DSM 111022]|nr:SGNH/GDSL hydrolase family protein [Aerococcaceae bacterium DSM 111022]